MPPARAKHPFADDDRPYMRLSEVATPLGRTPEGLLQQGADDFGLLVLYTIATGWPVRWEAAIEDDAEIRTESAPERGPIADGLVGLSGHALLALERDGRVELRSVIQDGYRAVLNTPVEITMDGVFVRRVDFDRLWDDGGGAPGKDLGVMADLDTDSGLRARVGAFNGGGDLFGDADDGTLAAARLEYASGDAYTTIVSDDGAFGVGASVLYGSDLATSKLGFGGDLLGRVGSFAILLEGSRITLKPTSGAAAALPGVFDVTHRLGITSQLSYTVKTDRGGVEIGARYSMFDDDTYISDNGDVGVVHGGLTWRDALAGVDIGGGTVLRLEQGGRAISNDSVRLWAQVRYPPPGKE